MPTASAYGSRLNFFGLRDADASPVAAPSVVVRSQAYSTPRSTSWRPSQPVAMATASTLSASARVSVLVGSPGIDTVGGSPARSSTLKTSDVSS